MSFHSDRLTRGSVVRSPDRPLPGRTRRVADGALSSLACTLLLGAVVALPTSAQTTPHPPQRTAPSAASVPQGMAPPTPPSLAPVPRRPPLPPQPPLPSDDPAEHVAPAGLSVEPGVLPITAMEAIAMRQELENLVGRFESALLAAEVATRRTPQPRQAVTTDPAETILVASRLPFVTATQPLAIGTANPVVYQVRQWLDAFPTLVRRGDYATARQQWLQARQLLWDHFPTDRPVAQPEIRAIWLDRGTIVAARSRQGLSQIFDQLAEAGINTVFFETVNAGYPIYPSQVAPQQNPLTQGWDPLADAVDLAHARNMELHAWVWVFAAGNTRHNTIVGLPESYPGPLLTAHPDWANYDDRGRVIPAGQTKPFLDPANPSVRNYLLQLYEEIVTRYAVDGLQLDYIRYPFQDPSAGRSYGYGLAARQQFQRQTGVDPIALTPRDRQLWEQWTAFRTEQVNSFVAETSTRLRRINPELVLSAAVFPLSEHERLQKLQQHWEVWARQGDVNLIVPMSYAADTNRLQRLVHPWTAENTIGPALIVPSIRLLNLPEAVTVDQMQAIRDMPAGGYALFAAADLNAVLQGIFHRTQGHLIHRDRPEPIPYRQPFQTAAARYEVLEQEWAFLRDSGQLWLRDSQREDWASATVELGQAMDQLAAHPSPQHLQQARQLLGQFRDRFDSWMSLYGLDNDYRVDTWQNHLATLETLLTYGEHFSLHPPSRSEDRL